MTKLKIKEVIQDDLNSIKNELLENTEVFIQKLVESLGLVKKKTFSAYKECLSLNYLKQVYERAFPYVTHGGTHIPNKNETKNFVPPDQKNLSFSWVKSGPLADRVIIVNLFKGVRLRGSVPSFVELVVMRSELSKTSIGKKIRAGSYIANCTEENERIVLFRSNKISYSKFLAEIITEEKR